MKKKVTWFEITDGFSCCEDEALNRKKNKYVTGYEIMMK